MIAKKEARVTTYKSDTGKWVVEVQKDSSYAFIKGDRLPCATRFLVSCDPRLSNESPEFGTRKEARMCIREYNNSNLYTILLVGGLH